MVEKKWAKVLGLAMALPSTIFASALFFMKLAENGIISKFVGVILFLVIVLNTLFLMVWYAYKKKN